MSNQQKLLPAAIYVRRSCAKSNESSCGDQKRNCLKKMDELGYYLAHEEDIFEDDVQSGAIFFTRERMAQIIKLLKEPRPLNPRPFEAIFVDDVSRIARNIAFCALFGQALRFHGIKLFDALGHEYTCMEGYCMLLIMGLGAEITRTFLSSQTSRGIHAAAKRMNLSRSVYGFKPLKSDHAAQMITNAINQVMGDKLAKTLTGETDPEKINDQRRDLNEKELPQQIGDQDGKIEGGK
jgi:DNA invertase Pin-like site-specific DNA recombinase